MDLMMITVTIFCSPVFLGASIPTAILGANIRRRFNGVAS
jgi:hypothetical protein